MTDQQGGLGREFENEQDQDRTDELGGGREYGGTGGGTDYGVGEGGPGDMGGGQGGTGGGQDIGQDIGGQGQPSGWEQGREEEQRGL